MKDKYKREINYMRISITDRCNLRCSYCMPDNPDFLPASELLSYKEIMRVVRASVDLGITRFKITGGEPLLREGAVSFLTTLKAEPGVERVTLTTNGIFLEKYLPTLEMAGIDGINISCDAVDEECYGRLTGSNKDMGKYVLQTAVKSAKRGISTKINCVAMEENQSEFLSLVQLAEQENIDIRFIEWMPLGGGIEKKGVRSDEILQVLRQRYPDLHLVMEKRGNGPADYYAAKELHGRIGMIAASSQPFCHGCNRIRLTSTGELRLCLCSKRQYDLKEILRNESTTQELEKVMKTAIFNKPKQHFLELPYDENIGIRMNQIGG